MEKQNHREGMAMEVAASIFASMMVLDIDNLTPELKKVLDSFDELSEGLTKHKIGLEVSGVNVPHVREIMLKEKRMFTLLLEFLETASKEKCIPGPMDLTDLITAGMKVKILEREDAINS